MVCNARSTKWPQNSQIGGGQASRDAHPSPEHGLHVPACGCPLGFLLGRIMGLQPPDLLRGEAVQGPVEAEISRLGQEGGHGLLVLRRLAVLVLAELVALHDLLIVALQLGLLQLLGQVPGQSLTLPGQLRRGGIPGIGNGGQVPPELVVHGQQRLALGAGGEPLGGLNLVPGCPVLLGLHCAPGGCLPGLLCRSLLQLRQIRQALVVGRLELLFLSRQLFSSGS